MATSHIFRIAIFSPLRRLFDYMAPEGLDPEKIPIGVRIRVPFGRRELIGILVEKVSISSLPEDRLKPILEVLDEEPIFTPSVLSLLKKGSEYYHHSFGDVLATALPVLLRQGKKAEFKASAKKATTITQVPQQPLALNAKQQEAITTISESLQQFKVFLLDGITGSGKTEVYLQIIAEVLRKGQQALVLVPEISLTPQMIERFEVRFQQQLAILHSGLTNKQRLAAWLQAKNGDAKIIIGTRSALFTPLLKPGIIIIDEEHDLSFKQQEGFRYSARDLAIVRAQLENIPVVLGSATPSFETLYNVKQNKYSYLHLPNRAAQAVAPKISLLDLRQQKLVHGISPGLLAAVKSHLDAKGQVLLFLNRRGFAPILICNACAWVADCKRCDTKMTYHFNPTILQCHHCGSQRPVTKQCPNCQNTHLAPLGLGTQRLEQTLMEYFPGAGIVRIDRDSTRKKGSLQDILQSIHSGEKQILIGTQMLAKGHHFPNVTLVGILNVDNGLFSSDFRAAERLAQLLIQVAGRAGRAERPGEVIIQTHQPDHMLLQYILAQDYQNFAELALIERNSANFAPYSHLALFRAEAKNKNYPMSFLVSLQDLLKENNFSGLELLGPIPALMERKAGHHRAQFLLQAKKRGVLHQSLNFVLDKIDSLSLSKKVRWSLDVDPQDFL